METYKVSALLIICMIFISSATPILGCGSCGNKPPPKHHHHNPKPPKGPITLPPIIKPPVHLPPVTIPPIVKPPVVLPPIVKPPVTLPPVTLPPIVKPPVTLPPVTLPPIVNPPVILPPVTKPPSGGKPCPPPPKSPSQETCPIDTLKLGACVDLLGGLVHIGFGDPAVNECCPVLQGLVELEAAVCLCTTLKLKLLNLSIFVPIALQLLVTCGKTPPPGYTCSI
ncbi:hypothetical protein Ddye_020109 [Dipteronia dyeriana]|uniref:Bifunctional inhibitor/plant lipid transfer protein/seed storage helical domain-containing protein n=1 Tax=Dipteronia dyeriana TaxID=168575 RepID=A0AAD9U038_9ROSI|nr:hypothetical protein Ddye_020109 [Dipteronia dyeriana]